ncbi:MAG TPA: TolC family protein, partial [Tepidisphaeraceae bacterium]|nr:TolC family protein [Tepidisphaeraceae bacterium]
GPESDGTLTAATTQQAVTPDDRAMWGSTANIAATGPDVVRMPLREIVQRAVANNVDVRVAGYDPAVEATRVIEAQARFDPVYFASLQYQDNKILTPGQAGSATIDPFSQLQIVRSLQGQTGLRQNMATGGEIELRAGSQRIDRDPETSTNVFGQTTSLVNPYYVNDITVQITQPLLRDFGYDVNQARITIARNTQRISQLDFRKALEDSLEELERTYWQLVQAERELAVAQNLLARTQDTLDILVRRRGQDVSNVQISQANASVAQRRAILIRARARVSDLSDQIKRLMYDPDFPVSGRALILPATAPTAEPLNFDLADQIKTALENRLELGQQQLRVASASTAATVAKNNLLPQLNLQGQAALQGIGESWDDAWKRIDDNHFSQYSTWSAGLQFEVPIGNRAARAIWQRSLLQRQQAIDSYRGLIETVSTEVKVALREVDTSWREVTANRQARFAAEDSLASMQQLQDAGVPLTPDFVNLKLDAQARLAQAEQNEAQAVAAYNIGISRLERAKGTLLRYNNVEMQEEPKPLSYSAR